jgi:hypothetical protein
VYVFAGREWYIFVKQKRFQQRQHQPLTEMTEFRCGGRGQLWSGNHAGGKEGI